MNTSKIIKTQDNKRSSVKTFFLKQFVCQNDDGKSKGRKGSDSVLIDAESVKAQAQNEANLIVEGAQEDAQRIRKEAYETGYADGERKGRHKAEQELATLTASFKKIMSDFNRIKQDYYATHQDIILELALKIARKVIHQEVQSNKEFIMGVLNSAIKLAIDRERLEIRIHPDDMEMCMKKRIDIIKNFDGIKHIVFEADESVGRGGAIVECAFGEIDARLNQQFEEVQKRLRDSDSEMEYA